MTSSLVISRIFAASVDVFKRKTVGRHLLGSFSIDKHNNLSSFSSSLKRLSVPIRCHPLLVPRATKHTGSKFSRGKDGNKVKADEDEDDEEDSKEISVSLPCLTTTEKINKFCC